MDGRTDGRADGRTDDAGPGGAARNAGRPPGCPGGLVSRLRWWALEQSHTVPPGPGLVTGRDENRRERPRGCRHHAGVRGARDVGEALVPAVRREVAHRESHWVLGDGSWVASVRLRPRRATDPFWQTPARGSTQLPIDPARPPWWRDSTQRRRLPSPRRLPTPRASMRCSPSRSDGEQRITEGRGSVGGPGRERRRCRRSAATRRGHPASR